MWRWLPALLASMWGAACLGCGGGRELARVSGKVTFNGKPVSGGSLTFSPQGGSTEANPGKPAVGVVRDGNYSLGTFAESDGAFVGKHTVSYSAPLLDYPPGIQPKPGSPPPLSGYEGLVPRSVSVEVKPGANQIDVELAPGGKS
ncbi:MAG: hypothetical protein U0744_00400 [Gemmataceae bacterium]